MPFSHIIFMGQAVDRRELMRHEHVCVVATCCAFLGEELEISPENQYLMERAFGMSSLGPLFQRRCVTPLQRRGKYKR